jgi:hypothetical protein
MTRQNESVLYGLISNNEQLQTRLGAHVITKTVPHEIIAITRTSWTFYVTNETKLLGLSGSKKLVSLLYKDFC